MQTFADAYLAIAVCLAIATVLVPLLRKINAPAAPKAAGKELFEDGGFAQM